MVSILQPQSQADVDDTNRIIREYLARDADYESDEAIESDDEVMPASASREDVTMEVDDVVVEDDDDDDDEAVIGDKWMMILEKRFKGQTGFGADWWDKQTPVTLAPLFFQLRDEIHQAELAVTSRTGRQPVWTSSAEEADEEDADETGHHLAHWLGSLTHDDLMKAKTQDIIWWMVDMCQAIDSFE